jgi:predicted nuclease of predicted toxin-antitoxin system
LIIWVDAQLSPDIATWIGATFDIQAHPVRDLGLRDAKDIDIFRAARDKKAVVMTKDSDFLVLLDRHGPPPQILWVTCGNTSNARLKEVLAKSLPKGIQLLQQGERLIEISDAR